jgi:hypothetical protein
MEKTIQVTLNQKEANLVLRSVEVFQEACRHLQPGEYKALAAVWDKVFDTGIAGGFGKEECPEIDDNQVHAVPV